VSNRTQRFKQAEIRYVPNESFEDSKLEKIILSERRQEKPVTAEPSGASQAGLPAHLARLCEAQLLTADEERRLFRRMNYLKYRANATRTSLDPEKPDLRLLAKAESQLAEAQTIRDRLINANMRLVFSIVRKLVTPQHSFDELLSDGIETLMTAVEKFDYDRGFRFSTYLYRSITCNAYRTMRLAKRDSSRYTTGLSSAFFDAPEEVDTSRLDEKSWKTARETLSQMLDRLDRRERLIIRARFGLGAHRKARTCRSIAEKLGISKERVRQLQQRAISKLRAMADENQLADVLQSTLSL
jgi:RNA polymerase primary sigma factor